MGLVVELLVSALMLTLVTIVHGTGISLMDRVLRTQGRELGNLKLFQRELSLMVPMALSLMTLHIIEIFIFAAFYMATGDAHTVSEAIYHSALAYTTLGVVEGGVTKWMILSAFEGLAGFLMIGWSSAVFVTDMDRVLRHRK